MQNLPSGPCSFFFAGADIVGINCHLDPLTCVRTVKLMKEGLEKAGLKAHLMIQPLGFHTPECNFGGYMCLPEFPFGQCFVSLSAFSCSSLSRGLCLHVSPLLPGFKTVILRTGMRAII